ncbi:hypothetical protein FACS1894169_14370 [Bacteroidia bacterium]|nr:hypothetical protein FACS1894169_14370 [Bacteroidia bacterium]
MNKARRKELNEIRAELQGLMERLEIIKDEEQESFDNMPEGLQYSERGEKAENAISNLEYAYDNISDAIDRIDEAIE